MATKIPDTLKIASGKVRELYTAPDSPDSLLFVSTDRISAFDVVLDNGIPDKGALLTYATAHWFNVLPSLIPTELQPLRTHFVSLGLPADVAASLTSEVAADLNRRTMQVRKLEVFQIEAIVRGYLAGSAWKEYKAKGTVHGMPMPAGLQECEKLPTGPIFTPSTKAPAGQHDENITPERAAEIIGKGYADRIAKLAVAIYTAAAEYADARGILIADTKFEFALDKETDEIVLVDEVLTPDSSRFWAKDSYVVGEDQKSFDKQIVRDWLKKEGLAGQQGVKLPDDVVAATEGRYKDAFQRLTGKSFAEMAGSGSVYIG